MCKSVLLTNEPIYVLHLGRVMCRGPKFKGLQGDDDAKPDELSHAMFNHYEGTDYTEHNIHSAKVQGMK